MEPPEQYRNPRIANRTLSSFISSKNAPPKPCLKDTARTTNSHNEGANKTHKRGRKSPTCVKKKINAVRQSAESDVSPPIYSICNSELWISELVHNYLRRLRCKHDEAYKENKAKAHSKRTFVCGYKEILKHVEADNIKCVFMARNTHNEIMNGPASVIYFELIRACEQRGIKIIQSGTKRDLSKAVNKFPYTNVVGVMKLAGFKEEYDVIMNNWSHIDQGSLFA